MGAWHISPALATFIRQFNAAFPGRDKRSDGTIGDVRHQHEAGGSDHNPDGTGTVCAFDGTHGPFWHLSLADAGRIANELVASGDERIAYVIFNRRIWTKAKGWHDYTGTSPHLEHFHLSVKHGSFANDTSPWDLPSFAGTPVVSVVDLAAAHAGSLTTPPLPDSEDEDDMPSYARNVATGAMIKYTTLGFTLLNPDQAELETKFGADFQLVDAHTFDLIVGQRDQTRVSLQGGARLDGRVQ